MASVYKRSRRKPISEGAEIVERRGKRFAVWTSRGRRRRGEVTDDGQAVLIEDRNYTVEWFNWQGKRQRTSGGPDKDAAEALGAKLEAEEMQRRRGLIDPKMEQLAAEGRRPIAEHLSDFRQHLHAKGNTVDHVKLVCSRLQSVVESCRFERLSDLTASAVQSMIAGLRDERSLRTCNGYLRATKSLSRWAWHDGRLAVDPLASLKGYNEQTDRRRVRRAISVEEFIRLIDAAEAGPTVEGIAGRVRAVMYVLSAWTGYRRKELASLTRRSFELEADPPIVTVQAAHSKRRRTDSQVLHPVVIERLTAWLAAQPEVAPDDLLFPLRTPGGCWRKTAKMMRTDLAAARRKWIEDAQSEQEAARREASDFLTYQDEDGLFADFHSHRHTFISNLGKAEVPLAMAQKLARHSDPKLTASTYTHLGVHDKAAAIERLPSLPSSTQGPESGQQSLRATGTDYSEPITTYDCGKGEHFGQQLGGKSGQNVATGGETSSKSTDQVNKPQVVTLPRDDKSRQAVATAGESGDERARTANPRLAKPVGGAENPEDNDDFPKGGASGAAVETVGGVSDPDLAMVVQRWESLPEAVRAGILAMVRAAGGAG